MTKKASPLRRKRKAAGEFQLGGKRLFIYLDYDHIISLNLYPALEAKKPDSSFNLFQRQ
jgi:hypothetical protein